MKEITFCLPDDLAQKPADAGLLEPQKFEEMIRARLHTERSEKLRRMRAILAANPVEPMSADEINAEIRSERVFLSHLIAAADDGRIELISSQGLHDELRDLLQQPKFARRPSLQMLRASMMLTRTC